MSLASQSSAPQPMISRSLGGYVSSSPVPNGSINNLFDLISMYTLKNKTQETIAIALINEFDFDVKNVTLKIVGSPDRLCDFNVAAVTINKSNYLMEHIDNKYAKPIQATFYDAMFEKSWCDVRIDNDASLGEQISFTNFNVDCEISVDGTMSSIIDAFNVSSVYKAIEVNNTTFRIERRDNTQETVSIDKLDYIATNSAKLSFLNDFSNHENHVLNITDTLKSNDIIGIWLQRTIRETSMPTNEELISNFTNGLKTTTVENIDLVIDYDYE